MISMLLTLAKGQVLYGNGYFGVVSVFSNVLFPCQKTSDVKQEEVIKGFSSVFLNRQLNAVLVLQLCSYTEKALKQKYIFST